MHFTNKTAVLLASITAATAFPLEESTGNLHHLFGRSAIYDASCDRDPFNTGKTFKQKVTQAFTDATEMARITQTGLDSKGNAFTESTAFTHYFGDGDKDGVKKMMDVAYRARFSPSDKNQGYDIAIKCGSDQDADCGPLVLAATSAKPDETTMVFCDLFFNPSTKQTKQDLTTKILGPKRGQWCQTGEQLPFFEVAGLTVLHEMTHLDKVGTLAGLSIRPDPEGFSSAGTVDVYVQGNDDDIAHYKNMQPWQAARELNRLWHVFNGDKSGTEYKPTTPVLENAESYAAAALEFYFLSGCIHTHQTWMPHQMAGVENTRESLRVQVSSHCSSLFRPSTNDASHCSSFEAPARLSRRPYGADNNRTHFFLLDQTLFRGPFLRDRQPSVTVDMQDHVPDSFNTFLLGGQQRAVMIEVPNDCLDPSRQKRRHLKSRRGCLNCRKRRVKCDEKTPRCLHCTRRRETCEWRSCEQDDSPVTDISSQQRKPPEPRPSPPLPGATSVVNLLHMKLFHQFESHTRHTLAFDSVWQTATTRSLECESLMQAILCLSARHLAFLHPDAPEYEMAAATHLSQTLSLFQQDLAKAPTVANIDCYLLTAMLLAYIVWTGLDTFSTGTESANSAIGPEDRLFDVGSGTRKMFMSSNFWSLWQHSVIIPHIKYSPRVALCNMLGLSTATMDLYQSFFDYNRPLTIDRLSIPNFFRLAGSESANEKPMFAQSRLRDENLDMEGAYKRVVSSLCVILAFLPEMRQPGNETAYERVLPDLARYIFTFPIVGFRESYTLTQSQNPKWWLLQYHFYRAARIVLPAHFWWAHQRSRSMEASLEEFLRDKCELAARQPPALEM